MQSHRIDVDASGTIEVAAFNQILELDDDGTYTYSKDMIAMYFAQVPTAFAGMDAALCVAFASLLECSTLICKSFLLSEHRQTCARSRT